VLEDVDHVGVVDRQDRRPTVHHRRLEGVSPIGGQRGLDGDDPLR
jgi:hypothetical protein